MKTINTILCWVGFHSWSEWIEWVEIGGEYRMCHRCGKTECE